MWILCSFQKKTQVVKRAFKGWRSCIAHLCLPPSTVLLPSPRQKTEVDTVAGFSIPLWRLLVADSRWVFFPDCRFQQQCGKCPLMSKVWDGKHPLPFIFQGKVTVIHFSSSFSWVLAMQHSFFSCGHHLLILSPADPSLGILFVLLGSLDSVSLSLVFLSCNYLPLHGLFAFLVVSLKNKDLGRNVWRAENTGSCRSCCPTIK